MVTAQPPAPDPSASQPAAAPIETFTDRYLETQTVTAIELGEDGSAAVTGSNGWTAGAPAVVAARLSKGSEYDLETRGGPFGRICGWRVAGVWLDRKSDQRMDAEHAEMVAGFDRRRREELAEHRSEWIGREENLPGWLKERIHVFHERGGEQFELDGWGYELVVCELAALYADSGGQDSAAVMAFAEEQGTSGNQHDCAKALARRHGSGDSLAGTVAALSPLTGRAFYEGASGE